MAEANDSPQNGYWWFWSAISAFVVTSLGFLLYWYPFSPYLWFVAITLGLFVAFCLYNPKYRLWRRANWCFGISALLAAAPSFTLAADIKAVGFIYVLCESSEVLSFIFLAAALFLVFLDSGYFKNPSGLHSQQIGINNQQVTNNAPVIHQPVGPVFNFAQAVSNCNFEFSSGDASPVVIKGSPINEFPSSHIDEGLTWRLVDDIRTARRSLERDKEKSLLKDLDKRFSEQGTKWTPLLRMEALLLLAEEEQHRILKAKVNNEPYDRARFETLMKEIKDARG